MNGYYPVLLLSCVVACGAGVRAPAQRHLPGRGSPSELEVPRIVITSRDVSSIPELLGAADDLAAREQWGDAAAAYERAYRLESQGALGDRAIWGAANAYDHAGNLERALGRFELFAKRQPGSPQGAAAMVRATRLLVFAGRFAPAGAYADLLLKKLELLNEYGGVAVLSAKALALLESGNPEQASYFIERGRDIAEAHQLDVAVPLSRELAQLYYALGESRRVRAERITFEPMPANFASVLEARCQLLLDAQSAYSDTMRANDAHWSAMAGYRVAELYQRLHQDLLAVRPPPSADTERKQQLWQGAVRRRYGILLSKAKGMAEHTLAMASRTGEDSDWVRRTQQTLVGIETGIEGEEAALANLPYTREEFDAYLAALEASAAAAPATQKAGTAKGRGVP